MPNPNLVGLADRNNYRSTYKVAGAKQRQHEVRNFYTPYAASGEHGPKLIIPVLCYLFVHTGGRRMPSGK